MKKLFSFLAIIGIILASNCSKIPVNNDPVIGKWTDIEVQASTEASKSEWIFNDAYLGRFHIYEGKKIVELTDFQWSEEDGVYTITYPGLENKTDDIVTMVVSENETMLKDLSGEVLATRE